MHLINGEVVYSATDLVGFLVCERLSHLERAATANLVERPMRVDPELDRISKRGIQHEESFVAELIGQGRVVTRIEIDAEAAPADSLRQAAEQTLEAIRRGDEVVYQAALYDGRRRGHPDFLIKVNQPSHLGAWSYEVCDTKLARSTKGSAVLQISFYSDLLASAQGLEPRLMHLALGGSQGARISLRVADYAAYYRLVKAEFEDLIADGEAVYPPPARPDPVEHCDICRWNEACLSARRESDDLSLVAGITARQRRLLCEREVSTRRALGSLSLPLDPPLVATSQFSLSRVREQARIQMEGEDAGKTIFELLDPARTKDGDLDMRNGLVSLPAPSPGDLFFDIEGDPFAMDDGVEYLFGLLDPTSTNASGEHTYRGFWSIDATGDVTFQAERQAFEAIIDVIMSRLGEDPDMHVYHYAQYEPTAIRRLMGRYGSKEAEVDRLLRAGILVDLYRVARQGVRASVESYSIKRLEALYGFERTIDLRDAGSSIAAFETWLELGGSSEEKEEILSRIEAYNRDDCVSTWKLREWLEEQRSALSKALGQEIPRPERTSGEPSEELAEALTKAMELANQLTEGLPDDVTQRTQDQQGRWLLAQLLNWHRREEKSSWWRYFYLIKDLNDEERVLEPDALGQLTGEGPIGEEKRSIIYRFRFPPQDHKISVSDKPHDPETESPVGEVVGLDEDQGIIDIKRGRRSPPPEPTSLVPLEYVSSKGLRNAIFQTAVWVVEHGIDSAGDHRAARDLLMRASPRVGLEDGSNLVQPGQSPVEAARKLAQQLDSSYLAIQGPPGSGKTSLGAQMIVDLIEDGRRVGVTANSHKVIGLLLEKVAEEAAQRGVTFGIGQRPGNDGICTYADATSLPSSKEVARALEDGDVKVVGGTPWLWSNEDMRGTVDVLFVDEAGQMSLANVIAAASAASNVVLLGDPQQLDQPLQGVHPPGAERSALAHILGENQTMPTDLGLFLDGTWRLHPDVCAFTSEVFYEGRLHAHPGRERQEVIGSGALSGSGIRFIPIDHHGRDTDSEEEALEIDRLVAELLTSNPSWIDAEGVEKTLDLDSILVVTPYNAQVHAIADARPGIRVGTVDKFQGQEAPISIYSMATSSAEEAPRGMEFLYSANRLNVATSRARCLTMVVASPHLIRVRCRTPRQMHLANALARLVEMAQANGS